MSSIRVSSSAERLSTADLVAAAAAAGYSIKVRLITDWVSMGLLAQPDPRGRGRGKGKSYTWPRERTGLLLTLLAKRQQGVGRIALLNVPIATWLIWGEQYAPLRQARRALATWARANLRVGPEKIGRTVRETLSRLDHLDASAADRRTLRALLQQIALGQPYDRDTLVDRVRRVMDPNEVGLARGLPEGAALTPELYAQTIECRLRGARHAERGELDDATWLAARNTYLLSGPVAPYLGELLRPNPLGILSPPAHERFEYALNGACHHLVQLLGQLSLDQLEARQTATTT